MLYPVQIIFDFIFPPTTHELRLRHVTRERFANWYRPHVVNQIICLSEYHLPEVQAAVAACKFEHSYHAAKLLSTLVDTYANTLPSKNTLFVAIPLSTKRMRERDFNQVERVLNYMKTLPYPHSVTSDLLIRTVHTAPQTSLKRSDRLTNLSGAFSLQEKKLPLLSGIERVILCDDVTTTGTTLQEAENILKEHLPPNIELICIAWAH